MEMNPLSELYRDFIKILDESVIKYKSEGDKYETLDSKKKADAYLNASLLEDSFNTYYHYDRDVLQKVFQLATDDEIDEMHFNKNAIPYSQRDNVLQAMREKIISEYVETNNYYRMLNGLPDIEDTEYVFVDFDICDKYGLNSMCPIHELSDTKIALLESIGEITRLIKENPTKKYLNFLGSKKIDIVTARKAKSFAVIRIPYSISETMWDHFANIYEQCREYFMSVIYINEYRQTIEYYDNFIALCIMLMTITQIITRGMKSIIERDFFDDFCIRTLFSVYGIPYFENMDSNTRKNIVQDLNILVQNKGTNKVLYDIASILGYDRLKIFKYYLMKVREFDVNGVPVEVYKTDPDTGEHVLDYEKMYKLYFEKVEIRDMDTYKSLLNTSNIIDYEAITKDDPYWINDSNLMEELYKSEYNFVETKYLGVSIAYRLTRILFENAYLLRMIFDKKDEIPGIKLDLPKVAVFDEVSLFDTVVLLCALVCKQNSLKGNILTQPSKILHVLGFNFQEDFDKIKQEILNNPYFPDRLTKYFKDSHTYTAPRVNELYTDMIALFDDLVEIMSTTNDVNVYDACAKLYKTIFFTDENQKVFNIGTESNPVYAETFLEYLEYMNKPLYDFVNEVDTKSSYQYISHICSRIQKIIPNLSYLGIFSEGSETTETMLVELIRFFKSFTTDMIGLDVVYIFDVKPELLFKLMDQMTMKVRIYPKEILNFAYMDHLDFMSRIIEKTELNYFDKIRSIHNHLYPMETVYLMDHIHSMFKTDAMRDYFHFWNDYDLYIKLIIDDMMKFDEMIHYIHSMLIGKEHLSFEDAFKVYLKRVLMREDIHFFDANSIETMYVNHDDLMLRDECKIFYT